MSAKLPLIYAKGIRQQTKFYYAHWLPNQKIGLGVVGELVDNYFFRPLTTLKDLGIDFDPSTDVEQDLNPTPLDLVSKKGVTISFKAAGEIDPGVPSVPQGKAGVSIDFAQEGSFIIKAEKTFEPRIRDVETLGQKILEAYKKGTWKWYYSVIYSVVESPYTDIMISQSSSSKIDLQLNADGNVGKVELGNAELSFSSKKETGSILKMLGSQNANPIFRLLGIKKSPFHDPIVKPYSLNLLGTTSSVEGIMKEVNEFVEDDTKFLMVGEV